MDSNFDKWKSKNNSKSLGSSRDYLKKKNFTDCSQEVMYFPNDILFISKEKLL